MKKTQEFLTSENKALEKRLKDCLRYLDVMVPQKIVAMRSQRGLSQREMADIIGGYRQNWNKVENGKLKGGHRISLEHALALSLYFDVSLDYIVKDDANQSLSRVEGLMADQLDAQKKLNKMLEDRVKELEEKLAKKK